MSVLKRLGPQLCASSSGGCRVTAGPISLGDRDHLSIGQHAHGTCRHVGHQAGCKGLALKPRR